jgi:hypothetical protein
VQAGTMGTASEVCGWSAGGLPSQDVHAALDPYLCCKQAGETSAEQRLMVTQPSACVCVCA